MVPVVDEEMCEGGGVVSSGRGLDWCPSGILNV